MQKLQVRIVLEILGRPAEHIKQSLNALLEKLGKEKGIKIMNKKVHDPIPVKDSNNLFTTFAEAELELDSLDNYFGLMFGYMPSNIELIYPESLNLKNEEFTILANRLLLRLHDYDAIAKRLIAERDNVLQKLHEVAPHLFTQTKAQEIIKDKKKPSKKKTKK